MPDAASTDGRRPDDGIAPPDSQGPDASTPHVVGIGASAGGLEPLESLVGAIPAGLGIAWVVVQHLRPDGRSILSDLLARRTDLPVAVVEDGAPVLADTVSVAPGGHGVSLERGRFRLEPLVESGARTPIDGFFGSLAANVGERAFCVVLSGTGSDGTDGLRRIKSAGGIAFVQRPGDARFPGMPDSARATGLVDFVLAPEAVPSRVAEIAAHRDDLGNPEARARLLGDIEAALPRVMALLSDDARGHDFSGYKPGTLVRRIERRMLLVHRRDVEGFIEALAGDVEERRRLAQDFMIGVTRFHRDPAAFEALARSALPGLFETDGNADGDERLRVWVPGCSTGEEVYSIAMLLLEEARRRGEPRAPQVFGTDIDASALYAARQGVYAAGAVEHLPDALRERYLTRRGGAFHVGPRLREACVFALHNVLADAPFSRVALVSCRNLLIYLDGDAQARALNKFHFALRPGGVLFLGGSESLGDAERLFAPIDARRRVFRRDDSVSSDYSTLLAGVPRPVRAPPHADGAVSLPGAVPAATPPEATRAERAFLDGLAAPFALVDARDELTWLSAGMTAYVEPASGVPSTRLDALLMRELRLPARSVVDAARREGGRPSMDCALPRPGNGSANGSANGSGGGAGGGPDAPRAVRLVAAALDDARREVVLTLLPLESGGRVQGSGEGGADAERAALEREVASLRGQLDTALAGYDASARELRGSNEELLTMNVELQSANEELETSREELQSINEELQTMNAELAENNDLLRRANDDLQNLFDGGDVATLFVDRRLCVRRFTPRVGALFGIRERDVGRPLDELARRFAHDSLERDARGVFRSLEPLEQEIAVETTGATFIMRMRPYRTADDRLDGVVLSFFDISARKLQERRLAENEESLGRRYAELETLYDATPVGLSLMDRELRWLRINEKLAAINGFPVEAHVGVRQDALIPDIDGRIAEVQRRVLATGEAVLGLEVRGTTAAEPDRPRDWIVDYYPVRAGDEVFALGCCMREVTEQKSLERELQGYVERQRTAVSLHPIHFHEVDAGGRLAFALSSHERLPGAAGLGAPFVEALPEEARAAVRECLDAVLAGGGPARRDVELVEGGARRVYDLNVEPLEPDGGGGGGGGGDPRGALLVWFEVTRRKRGEERAVLLLAELQHRVKNTLATVLAIVRFTSRDAASVEDMRERLAARLQAISRTHDLLTATAWEATSVRALLEAELAPYVERADGPVRLEGPALPLPPGQALAVGMALHELATNSVKHGALSVENGRVDVETWRDERGRIGLEWRERGGPAPSAPPASGFGRMLLERITPTQLDGAAELELGDEGVRYRLAFAPRSIGSEIAERLGRATGAAGADVPEAST